MVTFGCGAATAACKPMVEANTAARARRFNDILIVSLRLWVMDLIQIQWRAETEDSAVSVAGPARASPDPPSRCGCHSSFESVPRRKLKRAGGRVQHVGSCVSKSEWP